jgi:hypothetical protein
VRWREELEEPPHVKDLLDLVLESFRDIRVEFLERREGAETLSKSELKNTL